MSHKQKSVNSANNQWVLNFLMIHFGCQKNKKTSEFSMHWSLNVNQVLLSHVCDLTGI